MYRSRNLESQLARPEARAQLRRDGYPVEGGLAGMLDFLGERLRGEGDFPHEVGLFLGYPAADVEGFRKYGGRNCKLSGLWKVYGDVEWAGRYFEQCRRCRAELSRKVAAGYSLVQILPGATAGC